MEKTPHPDSSLIDAFGGTSKVAEFFEITTGAVSQWRLTGMPKSRKKTLRFARPRVYRAWELASAQQPQPAEASNA
ncbi:Cro/CI family transcriptional regulator [Castellaniella ginsengisoli]|uniref:Cro/CI family transcriptional regulator n=1 Tax=Castellaniella ginsengisoli TaxID=546114 RepID=A0AB39CT33_9BURK